MSNEPVSIDVCIVTYMRPTLLRFLLESLNRQKLTSAISKMSIIVVDNDVDRSAETIVADFSRNSMYSVLYDVEPVQNISMARNRSVLLATADIVAFIDDDEQAFDDWISTLVETLNIYNADAAFGPVLPRYTQTTPLWIKEGKFFERPRYSTGQSLATGRTGNACVRRSCLVLLEQIFNPSLGRTGGEDSDLFERLYNGGYKLIWCDSAYVSEIVPEERCRLRWLLLRAFRGGQTTARRRMTALRGLDKTRWFIYRSGLVFIAAVASAGMWYIHRTFAIQTMQKAASNIGQISAITSFVYEEYADK